VQEVFEMQFLHGATQATHSVPLRYLSSSQLVQSPVNLLHVLQLLSQTAQVLLLVSQRSSIHPVQKNLLPRHDEQLSAQSSQRLFRKKCLS